MRELNLYFNNVITSEGIKGMINMRKLFLNDNDKITDEGIKGMVDI